MVHVVEAGGEHQLPVTDSANSVHSLALLLLVLLLLLHPHLHLLIPPIRPILHLLLPLIFFAQTVVTNWNRPLQLFISTPQPLHPSFSLSPDN